MIHVTKASGEKEEFKENKLNASLIKTGISDQVRNQVISQIQSKLYDSIPTSEIYKNVSTSLNESATPYAQSRYGLKRAIMDLGPTGYPFEDFIAQILNVYRYVTQTRQIIKGKCISHEIDVIAEKTISDQKEKIMIEAKFHNFLGAKTNVHVALYTKARFDDIKEINNFNRAYLITNTKVTGDALSYATCSGMKIISWNYPEGESLRDLINRSGLMPVTALTTLSFLQKQKLLEQGIVMSKDICKKPSCLDYLNYPDDKKKETLSEAAFASNYKT